MLTDPVLGTLLRTKVASRAGVSYERPSVTDPTRVTAVTATRIVPKTPPELRHLMLLSDSQPLNSHAVDPTRDAPVESEGPRPEPTTVMLTVPVLGTLLRTSVAARAWVSYDRPSVTDPTRVPAVTATCSVPNTPPELLQRTLLSDSQPLASHAVTPTRDDPV
jgi:hypothetical protein